MYGMTSWMLAESFYRLPLTVRISQSVGRIALGAARGPAYALIRTV